MAEFSELWMDAPEAHDYPAAFDYLRLILSDDIAASLADKLKTSPLIQQKAKDLLRASGLALLDDTNPHVARDLRKIRKGKPLSPVLLVRGDALRAMPLIVADGYHRICASWHIDENALIPCRLVDRPAP